MHRILNKCLLWSAVYAVLALARLLLDSSGNLEVMPLKLGANFTVPESTYLWNATERVNLVQELTELRLAIAAQQALIQDLAERSPAPACDWEGTRCQCFFKSSGTLDDVLILLGSNCSSGRVGPTRVLDALVAQTIVGCSFFNTSGRCTDMLG